MRFYNEKELYTMGFKNLGQNVLIAKSCTIDDPRKISIGDHVRIDDFSILTGTIDIGDWTHIAHYVHLSGYAGIVIGAHCGIGARTTIYTTAEPFDGSTLAGPTYPEKDRILNEHEIIIRNLVIVGINSVMFPGSKMNPTYIGEGAVFHTRSLIIGRYFGMAEFASIKPTAVAEFVRDRDWSIKDLSKRFESRYNELYITAEFSCNWQGNIRTLISMATECKKAGVNAIKLQAFRKEDLHSRFERLESSVTKENVDLIRAGMNIAGMDWYVTPTYPEAVDFINPYVNQWKIRAMDVNNRPLIDKVLATGKKILLSSETPKQFDTGTIKTLYTISKYPTPIDDIDWDLMKQFDGYSCHTVNREVLYRAVRNGIKYLEIHVTPDSKKDLVDNPYSYELKDLGNVISNIRKIEHDIKQSHIKVSNTPNR